jgi:hypothetical protein
LDDRARTFKEPSLVLVATYIAVGATHLTAIVERVLILGAPEKNDKDRVVHELVSFKKLFILVHPGQEVPLLSFLNMHSIVIIIEEVQVLLDCLGVRAGVHSLESGAFQVVLSLNPVLVRPD